ncbi:MAG: M3 family metallopeptidase [Deltaproteobacteria bacterium]|nr:M3 family metallopeptidase [Deltaproteobacteria bacterium]
MEPVSEENPLRMYGALPRFDLFEPSDVVPGIRSLIAELDAELARLEQRIEATWAGLIEPLEAMGEQLGFAWGLVGHLMGVRNSDALREAHSEVQGEVVAFGLRQAQSQPIYKGLESLRDSSEFDHFDSAQKRIVESLLRDARHAGVGLAGAARERFNAIQTELAELATDFSNHVLDATKEFSLVLHRQAEMAGTPDSLRQLAAQMQREAGDEEATPESGPWRITLDAPSLIPFLEHSERRDLREKLYRTYIKRASAGEFDNTPIIERTLELRAEMAALLGFESYAALSIDSKMAPSVESVEALLEELRSASIEAARTDLETLRLFAAERDLVEPLALWDVAFYAERLREEKYDYSEESLRPYFPLPRVLEGLFALAERLFAVRIVAADGETSVWQPDVRFFRVQSEDGAPLAAFFLDPYSRPGEKRGGAWMNECLGRRRRARATGPAELRPVAYLVCNQTPPVARDPSLMSFDEVRTLFHEFGHGLQHMLTRVDYGLASGIRNIEWDAVELPSQFMENWCYQRQTLTGLSQHVESGEVLPNALFDKIEAARTFRAGTQMLRQIYFASMDIALHAGHDGHEGHKGHKGDAGHEDHEDGDADPIRVGRPAAASGESIFDIQRRIAARTTILPPLDEDRFLCSFGHIFAGGYAAGYYSYKWAEVLSADAFAAFEEAGLDDPRATAEIGRRFRDTVLCLGGSATPMQVFEAFRGRPPSPEALLRHSGLGSA